MCKRRQPSELRLEGFGENWDFKYMTIHLKFCFQLARSRDKKLVLPKGASNNRMDSIPVRIAETMVGDDATLLHHRVASSQTLDAARLRLEERVVKGEAWLMISNTTCS
jgi:hypothetical protein